MPKLSSLNKIIIGLFVIIVIVTSILLFLLFNKQRNNVSPSPTPEATATTTTELSEKVFFSPDAKRIKTGDIVYYFFRVVLVDKPSFDLVTGDALGTFYFENDPSKNTFKYRFVTQDIEQFQIGIYSSDFQSKSAWNIRPKAEFVDFAQPGTVAEMRGAFDLRIKEQDTMVSKIESILQIFKDSYGGTINVPDNFVFEAVQMGFVEK